MYNWWAPGNSEIIVFDIVLHFCPNYKFHFQLHYKALCNIQNNNEKAHYHYSLPNSKWKNIYLINRRYNTQLI